MSYKKKEVIYVECNKDIVTIFYRFVKETISPMFNVSYYLCKEKNLYVFKHKPDLLSHILKNIEKNLILAGVYAGRVSGRIFLPSMHLAFTAHYFAPLKDITRRSITLNQKGESLFIRDKRVPHYFYSMGKKNDYNIYLVMSKETGLPLGWGRIEKTGHLIPFKTPSLFLKN